MSNYNTSKTNSNQSNENIEKFSGSFENEQSGCSIFINETVNLISKMQAGGLYLYLMCRPKNWRLNQKQLAEHFKCNKETIYKYLSLLQEIGLLTRTEIREKGKFSKYHYKLHLHPQPVDNKGISPYTEKPYAVISDTYKTKNIKNKDKNKKSNKNTFSSKKVVDNFSDSKPQLPYATKEERIENEVKIREREEKAARQKAEWTKGARRFGEATKFSSILGVNNQNPYSGIYS